MLGVGGGGCLGGTSRILGKEVALECPLSEEVPGVVVHPPESLEDGGSVGTRLEDLSLGVCLLDGSSLSASRGEASSSAR